MAGYWAALLCMPRAVPTVGSDTAQTRHGILGTRISASGAGICDWPYLRANRVDRLAVLDGK